MENLQKLITGTLTALLGLLSPIQPLICCALIFVSVDFLTGVLASRKRALRRGTPWRFESARAWRTIYKLVFICGGIVLCWMIDTLILPFTSIYLANLFTGFVCGIEFWSYLENAADLSQHPVFRLFRRVMSEHLKEHIPAPELPKPTPKPLSQATPKVTPASTPSKQECGV